MNVTLTTHIINGAFGTRGYDYDIRTSFHIPFAAITVRYRSDARAYGEQKRVSVSYGSGGIERPISDEDEARFAQEMAEAWALAAQVVQHHTTTCVMFTTSSTKEG